MYIELSSDKNVLFSSHIAHFNRDVWSIQRTVLMDNLNTPGVAIATDIFSATWIPNYSKVLREHYSSCQKVHQPPKTKTTPLPPLFPSKKPTKEHWGGGTQCGWSTRRKVGNKDQPKFTKWLWKLQCSPELLIGQAKEWDRKARFEVWVCGLKVSLKMVTANPTPLTVLIVLETGYTKNLGIKNLDHNPMSVKKYLTLLYFWLVSQMEVKRGHHICRTCRFICVNASYLQILDLEFHRAWLALWKTVFHIWN